MRMDRRGYLEVAVWRGIPIRIHWTAPIGAILWCGGPSLVRICAFLFVTLIHEQGHAILVRRARARVTEITIHGMGGECWWAGHVSPLERAVISWGGVWAQCLLFAVTWVLVTLDPPTSAISQDLAYMFLWRNLYNAAFNLIPVKPLDGSEAWKLFPLLWKKRKLGRFERKRRKNARELREIQRELKDLLDRQGKR